jgi:hypothetical protein
MIGMRELADEPMRTGVKLFTVLMNVHVDF